MVILFLDLLTGLHVHNIHDDVVVNVWRICVGYDQSLMTWEISGCQFNAHRIELFRRTFLTFFRAPTLKNMHRLIDAFMVVAIQLRPTAMSLSCSFSIWPAAKRSE